MPFEERIQWIKTVLAIIQLYTCGFFHTVFNSRRSFYNFMNLTGVRKKSL